MKLKLFGNKVTIFLFLIAPILQSQTYIEESSKIAFDFYHNIMSPVKKDVSKCQFYPSCSHFGKDAIKEYGFLKGVLLTSDRLIRCSGGHLNKNSFPRVSNLLYDPPSKNFIFGEGHIWNLGISGSNNTPSETSDTSIFSFPKFLFNNKDYDLSILELNRIGYNSSDEFIKEKTKLLISINYLKSQNLSKARNTISNIKYKTNKEFTFNTNLIFFLINDLDNANLWCVNFLNDKQIEDLENKEIYNNLMLYSLFKIDELNNNSQNLEYLKSYDENKYNKVIDFIVKAENISYKSPTLAGVFSTVVPGSGYIYSGRLKEGLSAFLINGLLGAGIYSLFNNNNIGAGILTSMVSAPFYLGNIIGSVNASHLYNNKVKEKYQIQLRNELGIDYYYSIDFLNLSW